MKLLIGLAFLLVFSTVVYASESSANEVEQYAAFDVALPILFITSFEGDEDNERAWPYSWGIRYGRSTGKDKLFFEGGISKNHLLEHEKQCDAVGCYESQIDSIELSAGARWKTSVISRIRKNPNPKTELYLGVDYVYSFVTFSLYEEFDGSPSGKAEAKDQLHGIRFSSGLEYEISDSLKLRSDLSYHVSQSLFASSSKPIGFNRAQIDLALIKRF